ncbi:MAG: hypothetical protein N2111_12815 [Candidatus Sumerlaeaceae bacterium]|nr:hypothetical protein [Candidatus Sumerlaeaceae bacterium]
MTLAILAWFAPQGLAWIVAWWPATVQPRMVRPDEYKWIVVIGRARERMNADETTIPFYGSRIAVYQRVGDKLYRQTRALPCRSESTSADPPTPSDDSYTTEVLTRAPHVYGYVSVPVGFYKLFDASTERRRQFAVSDWYRADGRLSLPQAQVLRRIPVPGAAETTAVTSTKTFLEKSEATIHPLGVRLWDHRGSKGCICIYDMSRGTSADGSDNNDWAEFLGFLESKGIDTRRTPLALLIAPIAEVGTADPPGLADRLRLVFKPSGEVGGIADATR